MDQVDALYPTVKEASEMDERTTQYSSPEPPNDEVMREIMKRGKDRKEKKNPKKVRKDGKHELKR